MFTRIAFAVAALTLCAGPTHAQDFDPNYTGTFSIIALDPATGELGMGVQSKAFAVGNRTITGKGGLVVVAHQANSNPMYGFMAIQLLQAGMSPKEALDQIVRSDEGREARQVSILDIQGRGATWTGGGASEWKGSRCAVNYCVEGNTLAGPAVVDNLAKTFETTSGPLADRLLAALDAAQGGGGDSRGMQGAAITIFKPLAGAAGFSDRMIDLRVDDSRQPLVELRRLLDIYWSGTLITQGNAKINAGDLEGGMKILVAAKDKSPGNDNAYTALASGYLKMKQKAEALAALGKAIEINPSVKRSAQKNTNFATLHDDPDFLKLVAP
ncbi:MAG: DUF1028 domain-containing protein [Acidobacteriota bacterium]